MSLLNDMLKDLSTQKSPIAIRSAFPIHPKSSHRQFMYWIILVGIASCTLSLLFFSPWQQEQKPLPIIPLSVIPSTPPFPVKQRIKEPIEVSPEPDEVLPQSEEALSQSEETLPQSEETLPQSEEALSQSEETLPQSEETLPQSEEIPEEESPPELTEDNSTSEEPAQFSIKAAQESQKQIIHQYIKDGNLQGALSQVDELLRLDPNRLSFIYLKARILAEQGNYQKALILLESHNPSIHNHAKFYALEAAIYEALGRTEEAGGIYQTLLKLHPENGRYWLGLGIALEHKQAFHQAIEAYRHAGQCDVTTNSIRSYAAERLSILKG